MSPFRRWAQVAISLVPASRSSTAMSCHDVPFAARHIYGEARRVASRDGGPPDDVVPCDGRQADFGWMEDLQPAFTRRHAAATVDGRWRLVRRASPALHAVIGRRRGRDPGSTSSMGKAGTCSLASSSVNKPPPRPSTACFKGIRSFPYSVATAVNCCSSTPARPSSVN